MTDIWRNEFAAAFQDFRIVATLAGHDLCDAELQTEFLPAPHRPPKCLPAGFMAVYGFWGEDVWLKIGKAGPNSGPRYTSHHYNVGSSPSNLAASLANDPRFRDNWGLNSLSPREWIKARTHRANILISAQRSLSLLLLLEAFLQARLQPRYEGRAP
jgi:hypothetical protein